MFELRLNKTPELPDLSPAGEANDHVVLIGLSVDRDGSECGAFDFHRPHPLFLVSGAISSFNPVIHPPEMGAVREILNGIFYVANGRRCPKTCRRRSKTI